MKRMSSHGGFDPLAIEKAKHELLQENVDFSEQTEPLARNRDGWMPAGGFIEQHFDFAQIPGSSIDDSEEIKRNMREMQARMKELMKASYPGALEEAKRLRSKITDQARQLEVNIQAAQAATEAFGGQRVMGDRVGTLNEITKDQFKKGKDYAKPELAGANPAYDTKPVGAYDDEQKYLASAMRAGQALMPGRKSK